MTPQRRLHRWPFVASVMLHLVTITAVTRVVKVFPVTTAPAEAPAAVLEEDWITHLVFVPPLDISAPAGGGGGGGNRQPGPVRKAEGRGTDKATVRIARPLSTAAPPLEKNEAPVEPLPGLLIDARPLASGSADQIGLPAGGVDYGTSTGTGSGGGVGTGRGTGIGSGVGPGIGPGEGGGLGGGIYRVGSGVTAPTVIREVRPAYPPDALRARIQGSVVLGLVVTKEGLPADIRVVRSLASDLDEAAVRAVQEWRFRPGRLGNTPVNVAVTVVLDFSIH